MALSTGARWLKRGDTFDPEDHRMTHRLRVARGILAEQGITPTVEHEAPAEATYGADGSILTYARAGCPKHPANRRNVWSPSGGYCPDGCRTVWPAWATDDLFEAAFRAADELQNQRHAEAMAQIAAEERERAS